MKIGLALSGGGIRGIAHAGVLKGLEENGIKIDIIGGTSAGSMVASLYAVGYKPEEIYKLFMENSNEILGKEKFTFFKGVRNFLGKKSIEKSFRNGKQIEKVFKKLVNDKDVNLMSNIKMPIVIPSVDIKDSKEYIFTNNIPKGDVDTDKKYITEISVGEAVRASSSFPAVFNLCPIKEHAFIDGGALDNIPVEEVKKQGADKVIAVKFAGDNIDDESNIMDVVMKTIDIMGSKIAEYNLKKSDYILSINTGKMGMLDQKNIEKCFSYGYDTVNKKINDIKKILSK